jgi:hypothetical protein
MSRLPTGGFSGEAQYVAETTFNARHSLMKLQTFGLDSALRDELGVVWEECRNPNWDSSATFFL